MLIKERNPKAFSSLANMGFPISSFSDVKHKFTVGMKIAFANLIVVLFGLYSVKLVNIPM